MSDPWLIAVVIKPFVALVFFFCAYLVSRSIARTIPDGAIKRLLYDKTLQKRHPWKFALGFMFGAWSLIGLIALLVYL